jgi:hypothetical protein
MSVRRGGVLLVAVLGQVLAVFGCTVTTTPSGDGGTSSSSSGGPTTVTCHADSTVTCTSGNGWSCTGKDSPEQSQALVCSLGTADGAKTDYCCTPYDH